MTQVAEIPEFVVEVANALDAPSASAATRAVHEVVAKHLERLDSDVSVKATEYFNHSFVPDLVLNWKDRAGGVVEREIFLRHSLESTLAGNDLRDLAAELTEPIFLSLASDDSDGSFEAVAQEASDVPSAMVSVVPALARFMGAGAAENPVMQVVRTNLIRSGRGLIESSVAEQLTSPESDDLTEEILTSFNDAVERAFSPDAVVRIQRVAEIVRVALGPEDEREVGQQLSGRFSKSEVRALVPYLLKLENVTEDVRFWASVGELLTLDDIEGLSTDLSGVDLSRLVKPSLSGWRAKRAQLSRRDVAENDQGADSRWLMRAGRLSAEIGDWTLYVASKGTKLKGRSENGVQGRWDEDLRDAVAGFKVSDVRLSGVTRSLSMTNEGSSGARSDVDEVVALWDDSFHVPAITVQVGDDEDSAAAITSVFSTMLADCSPKAKLSDLVPVAIATLGYRYPVASRDLADLLGQDFPEEAASATL